MARLLSQLAVGETVTIQETGGGAQYYVAYHGYKNAVTSNPNNLVLFIRKGHYDTFVDSNKGYVELGESYNWNTSVAYSHANNYYNNILTDDIKNNIVNFSYYGPKATNGNLNASIYQQKVFVPLYKMLDSGYGLSKNDNIFPMLNLYGYGSPTPESINAQLAKTIISENVQNITTAVQVTECVPISSFLQSSNNSTPCLGGYERTYNNLLYCRTWNQSITCKFLPCFCLPNTIRVSDSGELYAGPDTVSFSNIPQITMIGESTTIQWQSVSDATSYTLERSTNGGSSYTQAYTGANTTFTETVGSDWTQLQYRVKAINADGESPYTVSPAIEVISSQVLVISGTDEDLGTLTEDIHYTVSSNTGNQINLTQTVNGVVAASQTVDSGFSYDIPILELPSGDNNTIVISASVATTGNNVVNAVRNWTYSKTALEFPNDVGISTLTQNGENIYPMSTMEAIRTYGFMGGTLDKTLMELANAGKIMSGSYVGTGTYGPDNPTVIHFDVKPDIVFVYTTSGSITPLMAIIGEESSSYSNVNTKIFTDNSVDTRAQTKFENNEFSIVNDGGGYADEYQMNGAGYTYYYIGIAG